jgi:hypothetical protein
MYEDRRARTCITSSKLVRKMIEVAKTCEFVVREIEVIR